MLLCGLIVLAASVQAVSASDTMSRSPWKVLPIYGGGFVQNVVVAPSNPKVWYNYVDIGGPYRSDDAGAHWYPLHQNMPLSLRTRNADFVRTLSVDPRDENSIVLAAGNNDERPAGILVSRNGGRTFRQTLQTKFFGDGVMRPLGLVLARNPENPDMLICGGDWDGVFLSRDNGETWTHCGLEGTVISDLKWDGDRPVRAYACSPRYNPQSYRTQEMRETSREYGFWRSDDGGRTWRKILDDPPIEIVSACGSGKLVGIFGCREVRVSSDGGETWSKFHEGLPYRADGSAPAYREADHFFALGAGPDFWLVGNSRGDLFRRGFGEGQWTPVRCESMTLGNPVAESHLKRFSEIKQRWALGSIVVAPDDPSHWLTTDWFHVWESKDAGVNWTSRVEGMMQLVPFCVECDPNNPDNICVGSADMGLHVSNDGGKTFNYIRQTGGGNSVVWLKGHKDTAFCTGGKFGIQFIRTTDGGRSWSYVCGKGLPPFRKGAPAGGTKALDEFASYTVASDPTSDDVYLCVSGRSGPNGGGVYRSHDLGESWERFSDGLPEGVNLFKATEFDGGGSAGWTPELVFGADGSAVLSEFPTGQCYALDRTSGKWVKTACWNKRSLNTIAADPFRPGRFLASTGNCLAESTDGGRTWHRIISTIGCERCVAFDAHRKDVVVSANDCSILISRDGGRHFNVLKGGLQFPSGDKRWVRVDRGRLFALTRGSGVFVRQLEGNCGE